jgi:hypothetical protein
MKTRELAEVISPEALDALLRNDMASFVRAAFAEVSADVDLIWAGYLDMIAARLADVAFGRTRRLIITVPPRHLKSICVSVGCCQVNAKRSLPVAAWAN